MRRDETRFWPPRTKLCAKCLLMRPVNDPDEVCPRHPVGKPGEWIMPPATEAARLERYSLAVREVELQDTLVRVLAELGDVRMAAGRLDRRRP